MKTGYEKGMKRGMKHRYENGMKTKNNKKTHPYIYIYMHI